MTRIFTSAAAALAVAAAIILGAGLATPAGAQDPQAAVDNLIEAANESFPSGDGSILAAAFTEDGVFASINGGSFAIVGREAMTVGFSEEDPDFQVTLLESTVDGDTVTGSVEVVDADTIAAGVDTHIELFTAVTEGDLVSSLTLTYDESDPDTATYLAYLEANEGEPDDLPPGSVTIALEGDQPGQAFIGSFEAGTSFMDVEVTPGAEGVAQPAHVHTGTCDAPGPIVYPIASVVEGRSFTILSADMDELLGSDYIVNVHLSPEEADTYVSCAVLEEAEAPAPTAAPGLPSTGGGPASASGSSGLTLVVVMLALSGALAGAGALAWRARA